jgi:hypothetical protein
VRWFVTATLGLWVLVASAVVGLLAGALRGQTASMPSLTHADLAPVPVVAVLALAPALATIWGWSGVPWTSTASAVRRPAPLLVRGYVLAPAAYALASLPLGGTGAVVEDARNALGLGGASVLAAGVAGERGAVAAPVAMVLTCFLLGRPSSGSAPYPWAWVIQDGWSVIGLVCALTLWLGGLLAISALPRRLAMRGED